ncbi:Neurogenic locus Notch protein, partial [Trichoplax sp. H2]
RASTTACDSQPCFRGYCQSINTNEYRCLCYNGYLGQLCNEAINASGLPCGSSPCTAGKCVNVRNETGIAYLCLCNSQNSTSSCVPEYSRCPSPCASNPCLNGQCSVINRGTTYACGCWPGYTGKNCESTAHWQSCSVYKGSFCAGHVNYLATKLNDANKYEKSLSLVYSFAQATGGMPYECLRFSKPYVCSSLYLQCYNGTSFNSMCQSDCLKYQTFRKNCFSGMIGSDKEFGLKSCSSIKQNNPPQCFHIQDPPSPDVIDYKECFVYSGNVCSGYLPSLNVTVAGNIAADLAEKDIKNSIDLLNTASNFSLTCREYISATLCHTTFKQCDDHSNLCKSDCYRMVKLFKTCASQIPGVQQSILYPYINCAKLSDDDCVSYNVPYPQPVDNKIRLVNGNNLTLSSGIVEIIKNDTWYRLCYHHGWNMVSAQVACKQLGYRGALSTGCCGSFPTQPYGGNPQLSVMASIYCTGEEKYIGACQFKRDQSATCDVRNSAGVICSNSVCVSKPCNYGSCVPNKQDNNAYTCKCDPGYTGQNCDKVLDNCRNNPCPVNTTCVRGIFGYKCVCKSGESCTDTANYNITARLVNHWEGKPYTGVLEFYYNGTWGPSCEVNAAAYHTACRSIGYKRAFATSCCSTGHYASSIRALDFILCNENAQNLYECSYGNYIHRICANHGGFWNTITCTNDACLAQPCGNHGQCVHKEFNNDYYCVCDKYFTGNNCEQALACASSPCQNGGNCTNDLTSYNCLCPSNYFGQNCDQLPACSSNPCITGTCVNFNNNTYQCQCSSKFTGQRCESGLACNSNPCLNGASCVINDVGDYQCGCMNGFTGKNCETHQYLFNGNVRLQGGSTSMDGYAEVYYNGSWRGICDDNFGLVDGQVICRQLGYVGAANIKCCSNFGTYNGKYWLTNVDCYGDESEISDCRHDPWGNVNCAANEAITVICTNNPCLSNKCNRNPCEITNATEPVQYKCTCTSAQSGKNCQLRNICQFNPCNSPQNCTDESYGYSCSCPNGYYGTSCTSSKKLYYYLLFTIDLARSF